MVILTALLRELKSYSKNLENRKILFYCLIKLGFMKSFGNQEHFYQLQLLTHHHLKANVSTDTLVKNSSIKDFLT